MSHSKSVSSSSSSTPTPPHSSHRLNDSIGSVDHWIAEDVLLKRRSSDKKEEKGSESKLTDGQLSNGHGHGHAVDREEGDEGEDERQRPSQDHGNNDDTEEYPEPSFVLAKSAMSVGSVESASASASASTSPSASTSASTSASAPFDQSARGGRGSRSTTSRIVVQDKESNPNVEPTPMPNIATDTTTANTADLDAFDLLRNQRVKMEKSGRGSTPIEEFMRKLNVVVLIVETSYGRDKLLKCFQYSARTYLWLYLLLSRKLQLPFLQSVPSLRLRLHLLCIGRRLFARDRQHLTRLNNLVSGLSLARKCLLLFGPLAPLLHLLSPTPLSGVAFFDYTLSLLSACSDDIFCLSKLGVVSKKRGMWADKWANRFWFSRTVIELVKLHASGKVSFSQVINGDLPHLDEMTDPKTAQERVVVRDRIWSARKLYCDFIFSGYNVFNLTPLKEPVQCIAGLTAGIISISKLYDKHLLKLMEKKS